MKCNQWMVLAALGALNFGCVVPDEGGSDGDGGPSSSGGAGGNGGVDLGNGSGGNGSGGNGSGGNPSGGAQPPVGGGDPPAGGADPPAGGAEPPAGGAEPPVGGAEPPVGGTEPPVGEDCFDACDRFGDCAVGGDCECVAPQSRGVLVESCLDLCEADSRLAAAIEGGSTCADVLEVAESASNSFAEVCHGEGGSCGGSPPVGDHPECAAYAGKLVECVTEACPNMAGYSDGFTATVALECNDAVDSGQIALADAAAVGNAPCGALAQAIAGIVGTDPNTGEPGALNAFCMNGPVTGPETCGAACTRYAECLPPEFADEPQGNPEICAFSCAVDSGSARVFECFAGAADCQAALACEADVPPPPPEM
ncbi:MAG: hypothetical protein EXR76_12370 [Myxococcales bacterium]|nr:hypothetical protein [Myxococcales bacterium]